MLGYSLNSLNRDKAQRKAPLQLKARQMRRLRDEWVAASRCLLYCLYSLFCFSIVFSFCLLFAVCFSLTDDTRYTLGVDEQDLAWRNTVSIQYTTKETIKKKLQIYQQQWLFLTSEYDLPQYPECIHVSL